MDISKLRNITNNYRDVRLISLRNWKHSGEIESRDTFGPYVIYQAGFDPEDLRMTPTDFVLGRSGAWVRLAIFLSLDAEVRRQEFIFGTASEVMALLEQLGSELRVIRTGDELSRSEKPDEDDLAEAVLKAKSEARELER